MSRGRAAAALLAAVVLTACSGPPQPAYRTLDVPVTGTPTPDPNRPRTPAPAVAGAFASEVPSPTLATTAAPTASAAPPWCRSTALAVAYLGGDTTTLDPALDTIERYRLTNTSTAPCRLGAWLGVRMIGVSGCPMAPVTTTPTVTAVPCPAGAPAARGRAVHSKAWPARDQQLAPGASTVLSLLFADTFAPQSCAAVWAPPDRLELRPAGDQQALVVPSKVYPCKGELVVAPLGFGL
jgi:hypothetical protein